jgi:hypothetical protein
MQYFRFIKYSCHIINLVYLLSMLFSIQSPGLPCIQIHAQDAYYLQFGHSSYAWKDKEIYFSMQLVSWSIKIGVTCYCRNNFFLVPTDIQYFFSIKHSRHNYCPLLHSSMHDLTIPCIPYMLPYLFQAYFYSPPINGIALPLPQRCSH